MADTMPLVKGTLDLIVLRALTWSAMHGFEITTWIEQRSGGQLAVNDSALYQALYRLEERGLVSAAWGLTENNRKARYYRILRPGHTHLEAESSQFVRYAEVVSDLLRTRPNPV